MRLFSGGSFDWWLTGQRNADTTFVPIRMEGDLLVDNVIVARINIDLEFPSFVDPSMIGMLGFRNMQITDEPRIVGQIEEVDQNACEHGAVGYARLIPGGTKTACQVFHQGEVDQ